MKKLKSGKVSRTVFWTAIIIGCWPSEDEESSKKRNKTYNDVRGTS